MLKINVKTISPKTIYDEGKFAIRARYFAHEHKGVNGQSFRTYTISLGSVQFYDMSTGEPLEIYDLDKAVQSPEDHPLAFKMAGAVGEAIGEDEELAKLTKEKPFAELRFARATGEAQALFERPEGWILFDASAINFKRNVVERKDGTKKTKLVAWLDCDKLSE